MIEPVNKPHCALSAKLKRAVSAREVGRGVLDEPFDFTRGSSRGNGAELVEGARPEVSPYLRHRAKRQDRFGLVVN
jgi:hypothetical protein